MTTPGVMPAATLHAFHVHVYGRAGMPPDDAPLAADGMHEVMVVM